MNENSMQIAVAFVRSAQVLRWRYFWRGLLAGALGVLFVLVALGMTP